MTTEDLWGNLPEIKTLRTPLVILKEQAELLQEKTDGLLVGHVKLSQDGTRFLYIFSIIAPTLNNYTYHLLTVMHDIGFYPLTLVDNQGMGKEYSDEEQYKKGLRNIFISEDIQNVISKLLTHVMSQE
jgi:hypothetical protein